MAKKLSKKHRQTRTLIIIAIVLAVLAVAALASYLIPKWIKPDYTLKNESDPVATLTLESGDVIILELYPDIAPNTVANFIELANSGFYDGLIFHRVISGFMIQGGDPNGNGSGGPGWKIKGEFAMNGFDNPLSHKRGVLSMARANDPDSAGSQFFIMHADALYLDGQYAAFGEVVYGMDAVDRIASVRTDRSNKPLTEQKIKSIRVDTKGVTYTAEKIGG